MEAFSQLRLSILWRLQPMPNWHKTIQHTDHIRKSSKKDEFNIIHGHEAVAKWKTFLYYVFFHLQPCSQNIKKNICFSRENLSVVWGHYPLRAGCFQEFIFIIEHILMIQSIFREGSKHLKLRMILGAWRHGLVAKSTRCSYRGSEFASQQGYLVPYRHL